jgi:GT2 family glycosyltransferase
MYPSDGQVLETFLEIQKMKSVSVVIPNFNGRALMERFLPSVKKALQHPSISAGEIIVSDDASTDTSVAFLKEHYPEIIIVESPQNRGFAPTANSGIRRATMDTVLLLNTDMELMPDTIGVLIDQLNDTYFGVSCAVCDPKDGHIQEGLKLPKIRGCKISYTDDLREGIEGETMYLCGGIALIDREKLNALCGYDERYAPFYYEDMDLSLRAKEHGWISWYTGKTRAVHQHAATIGSHFSKEEVGVVFIRNRVLVSWRFLPHRRVHILLNTLFHALQERLSGTAYRPYGEALKRLIRDK